MGLNVLLTIEYDGSGFSGWQKQNTGVRTVQGEIEHVLKYIVMDDVPIQGTSRTDAGVHALGQCASLDWNSTLPVEKLPMIMNRRFGAGGKGRSGAPGDIRILSAEVMPEGFHARYSCVGKTYRYIIDRSGSIWNRKQVYQLEDELDIEAMRRAAKHIIGTHDFKAFETAGGTPRETTVRTIYDLKIFNEGSKTVLEVTGDGFLYNMVRIMTGTLVEVGLGKRTEATVAEALEACDRQLAGFTAPPQGLYLKQIYFKEEDLWKSVHSEQ